MGGAGIPGFWVDGAGGGSFSAACKAALAACGINPDNFGSYTDRLKAQSAQRKAYREQALGRSEADKAKHEPGCPFRNGGKFGSCSCHSTPAAAEWFKSRPPGDGFLLANSQSGHLGQNAFSQSIRSDPCSNMPPADASGEDGGSYGYDDSKAGCTDHFGKSTDRGTTHYEVTRKEATEAATTPADDKGRVSEETIAASAKSTAVIMAEGTHPAGYPGVTPEAAEARKKAETFETAQKNQADELAAKHGVQPNSKCSKEEQKANKEKAAECVKAYWKMKIDQMRMDAIDEHSVAAKSPRCKQEIAAENASRAQARAQNGSNEPADVKKFSDLSPEQQKAIVQDKGVQDATAAKMNAIRADATSGAAVKGGKPTKKDCREYQANWLANAGWGDGKSGKLPGFSGRVPGPEQNDGSALNGGGESEE